MAAVTGWSKDGASISEISVGVGETVTVTASLGSEFEYFRDTMSTADTSVATVSWAGSGSGWTAVVTITGVSAGTTETALVGGHDTQDSPLAITVLSAEDESYLNKRGLTHFWENIDDIKQNKLTAGAGISITNDVISATGGGVADSVAWGHITGTMSNQTDLTTALAAKANTADLAAVATSGAYNDLSDKPTIPTVNNATLTIQKNGTNVQTFTANQSTNATANITVPEIKERTGATTTTDITPLYVAGDGTTTTPMALKTHGDAHTGSFAYVNINEPTSDISEAYIGGYVWDEYEEWWRKMSEKKLALYSDIPTVNNATLTIQKNGSTVNTFTANASSNVTANITVPTQTSELTNNSGFLTSSTGVTSVNGNTGAVTGIQTTGNLVTSVSSSSTNSQYPSAKLFYDTVGDVESILTTLNNGGGAQ